MDLISKIGAEVKRYREGKGLSLRLMCPEFGLSYPRLKAFEDGASLPRADALDKILKAIGYKAKERKRLAKKLNNAKLERMAHTILKTAGVK